MTNASRPEVTFQDRHIGPSADDIARMARIVGVPSVDALIDQAMPANIRRHEPLALGAALSEAQLLDKMQGVASRNRTMVSLIGQGYYDTLLPPVIQRNVLENPAWYTSYTPYQPEISQGRLEALLNFQTMVIDLTGLPIANASLLDEATAAAEAMAMAHRIATGKPATFFVDHECHPQTIAVVRTRAEPLGWTVKVGDPTRDLDPATVFGALLQYPGTTGTLRDDRAIIAALKDKGAVAVMAADPLALTLLTPPGELGADIAIGSMQRFGVPMGYGGPHAAYIATKTQYQRSLPGRLVGATIDKRGRLAYRLALQTREQHIRREKATSNVCTAQVLLAVMAGMYAVYHGPDGLSHIARRVHHLSCTLASGLERLGFAIMHENYFDTIRVEVGAHGEEDILAAARAKQMNLRVLQPGTLTIALDETTLASDVVDLWSAFNGGAAPDFAFDDVANATDARYDERFQRVTPFLTHPVFHRYRSETEMLRYMYSLQSKDFSLVHGMIPLGSCTMKLNATAEMIPVTWPEFGQLHPFAPASQTAGYAALFKELEADLADITGFAGVSLQPNAGSQGEYAGLLVVRAYHEARGDHHRTVCLIPQSAHGTNPAS
ncbi:MAG: aminomethyl-transferring glycine dehydrogenase, partial [Pseudolabrys sp.]|nr:aminomethyl-transferring glycine dehydrogenase [Pseudolabrys sp.]